jgi:hypothetical protein
MGEGDRALYDRWLFGLWQRGRFAEYWVVSWAGA